MTRLKDWLYENTPDDKARFVLGERGERMLACLGINPSTARPGALDNTLRSVKRIAHHNGYDGWVMFNVYPLRATNPSSLPETPDGELHQHNLNVIKQTLQELKLKDCWLAYGNLINSREYLGEYFWDIHKLLTELRINCKNALEPTGKGHPRHPLYLPSNSILKDFDLQSYTAKEIKAT